MEENIIEKIKRTYGGKRFSLFTLFMCVNWLRTSTRGRRMVGFFCLLVVGFGGYYLGRPRWMGCY